MDSRYKDIAKLFSGILEKYAEGMGQAEVAQLLGTKQPTISRIKRGDILPPEATISRMQEVWGIDISDEVYRARKENSRIANRGTRQPVKNSVRGVPFYNVDFVGGFDMIFSDEKEYISYYIDFKPYERATCWCNITGHSMEPEINHGDIIALREIKDKSFIPFGEIYAIVTKNDMRTVKRVVAGSRKGTLTLIPSNKSPEYTPQEIDFDDILHIYEVMGCMKRF